MQRNGSSKGYVTCFGSSVEMWATLKLNSRLPILIAVLFPIHYSASGIFFNCPAVIKVLM